MSKLDANDLMFSELASALAARCAEAIESGDLDALPNDSLGQIFASVVRLYATKAQAGEMLRPFGRNSGVTSTDVAIGCSAMLEGVGLTLFDLGAWQTLASVRPAAPLHDNASQRR